MIALLSLSSTPLRVVLGICPEEQSWRFVRGLAGYVARLGKAGQV